MSCFRKINEFCEKLPIGFINLISIISSVITIITPIVGIVSFLRFYPKNSAIFVIYIATVVILFAMLLIMLRYLIKYRNLMIGVKKVSTNKFFDLTRNFRNSYFDILSYKKTKKLTIELLTEKVEKFLRESLDDICQIFKEFTYQDVSACIKYIDCVGEVDRETATIKTFVRSSTSDAARSENDNSLQKPLYVKDNTDFYSILSPNSQNRKSYFYQRNLPNYAKELERNGEHYCNSTDNWERYYKSTIVVPISVANKRLFFNSRDDNYNVLGFLCIDSLSTDAFLEKDERYNRDIAKAFAAELYIILNQYRHYLAELTA